MYMTYQTQQIEETQKTLLAPKETPVAWRRGPKKTTEFPSESMEKTMEEALVTLDQKLRELEHAQVIVEEFPEKVQIIETKTYDGAVSKQVIKKRIIRKRKPQIQEITEIISKQFDEDAPEHFVSITELPLDEVLEMLQPFQEHPDTANVVVVEELPEQMRITNVQTNEGPKKQTITKRVIKKKTERRQSVTEIITKQIEGKAPITSVTITETDLPLEETDNFKPFSGQPVKARVIVEELPEHVQIFEGPQTFTGPQQRTIIKKRIIKKHEGPKHEETEIITKQVHDQRPETIVTVSYIEEVIEESTEPLKPFEEVFDKAIPRKASIPYKDADEYQPQLLQEFVRRTSIVQSDITRPEIEEVTEVHLADDKAMKKTIKRRVTKKKRLSVNEIKAIITPIESITLLDEETLSPLEQVQNFQNHTYFNKTIQKIKQ